MKTFTISLCVVALLLWAGAAAWAEGKSGAPSTKERDTKQVREPSPVTGDTPSSQDQRGRPEKTDKAGKAAKQADQGKKGGQPAETAEKGKGKGGQQQLQAFQKQLQHEQGKHMERQARLARIRELAVQKSDAETIARVDKLIAKEQEVFGRKLQQMQGQQRAIQQPGAGAERGTTPPAGPTEVGAGQPKEKPAGDANEVMKDQNEPAQEKAKTEQGAAGSGGRTKRQKTGDRQGDSQK